MSEAQGRRAAPARGSRALKPKVVAPGPATLARAPGVAGRAVGHPAGRGPAPGRPPAWASRPSATCCSTCPRRYDDLRELRTLADIRDLDDGSGGLGAGPRDRHLRPADVAAARAGHDGPAHRRHRLRDRHLVRAALHRAPRQGRRRAPDLGQGQAPQRRAGVRGTRVPAGGRREPPPRRPHRAGLPAHQRPDCEPPSGGDARRARPGRARLPGVPAGPDPGRRRTCRRSARRSSTPTTRPRSRPATPRCGASRWTSCSRSSWGWSRAGAPADGRRTLAVAGRRRGGRPDPVGARGLAGPEARRAGVADRRPGDGDRRDPRRPRPTRPDAPPRPGRRRLGQDGRRGVGPRGGRPRRAAGGAARADGPARAPAPRDADLAPRGPRPADHAAHRLAVRRGPAERDRGAGLGAGGDRGRDARAAPGEGGVRRPRAGRGRRAAPVRRGAARGARGEGDAGRARTSC